MKKGILFILFFINHFISDAQVTLPNLQSLQYVNSNLGNALNFDGITTYALGKAYVKDSIIDFTLEFWVKNTGADDANDRIYASANNDALQIAKNGTQLKLKATDLGGLDAWQTVCTLELNQWNHIAIFQILNSSIEKFPFSPSPLILEPSLKKLDKLETPLTE